MNNEPGLNYDELLEAAELIFTAQPGEYKLAKLYDTAWERKKDTERDFGKRFKKSLDLGELPNAISYLKTDTANHHHYTIAASE